MQASFHRFLFFCFFIQPAGNRIYAAQHIDYRNTEIVRKKNRSISGAECTKSTSKCDRKNRAPMRRERRKEPVSYGIPEI